MQLDGCPPVEYIKRRNQRNLRIRVKPDVIVVSGPWYSSQRLMSDFVREREKWIRDTITKLSKSEQKRSDLLQTKAGHVLLRGVWVPIVVRTPIPEASKWYLVERAGRIDAYPPGNFVAISNRVAPQKFVQGVMPGLNADEAPLQEFQKSFDVVADERQALEPKAATPESYADDTIHFVPKDGTSGLSADETPQVPKEVIDQFSKDLAKKELPVYFEKKAGSLPFKWDRLFIRSQKTKWGTCSSKGNISLNWRLIKCPVHIWDYLIVHELSHTVHMNHSRPFWELVRKHYPDVESAHKWLKNEGNICFL